MSSANNRVWIILEQSIVNGKPVHTPLAGTEDEKAINVVLAALQEYKNKKIQNNELDLTEIRSTAVEKLNPINQILEQDEEEAVERLMSMVED